MKWRSIAQNWILTPSRPKGVIHFLGGAFFASAPQISYSQLLESLAHQGYVIVATPFLNSSFDHKQTAIEVYEQFLEVSQKLFLDAFPTFGMGHSMGCKLHLILNCLFRTQRLGNIFLAYNNYSARRSIPFFRELQNLLPSEAEFTPSPDQLNSLIADRYNIAQNLLIKFLEDDIDEIPQLANLLQYKFEESVVIRSLPGNHLTSMGVEVHWQPGKTFSPLDALGQWVKQGVEQDNTILLKTLLAWLTRIRPLKQLG